MTPTEGRQHEAKSTMYFSLYVRVVQVVQVVLLFVHSQSLGVVRSVSMFERDSLSEIWETISKAVILVISEYVCWVYTESII